MKEAVFEEKLGIIYDEQKRTILLVICLKLKAMSYCQARTWNVQNIVEKFNDANGNDCNKFDTRIKKSLDLVIQASSIKWK
jgi:pantothenate kinase